MTTMTGGDVLVETLGFEDIRHVFSIPGGQLLPIYDAIREHPRMDMIVPRHEGASGLMACGYSMANGKPAVVMSTVGAGVIYEAGGLLLAYRERLPVLSIAPQVQSWKMKPIQESLQACDQDEIFRPFTKFRAIVYHYNRIPQLVRRGLKVALAPEPGPIHLDIPVDVLFEYHNVRESAYGKLFPGGSFRFEGRLQPDEAQADKCAKLLSKSKKPLALVGRGARTRAGSSIEEFLEAVPMPTITSMAAFSAVSTGYENRIGCAPAWKNDEDLDTLAGADTLLLIEADEETARLAIELYRRNPDMKVVQIAASSPAIGSVVPIEVGLLGTEEAVLDDLAGRLGGENMLDLDDSWVAGLRDRKGRIEKEHLAELGPGPRMEGVLATVKAISSLLRSQDYVVCDGPLASAAAISTLEHPGAHRTFCLADNYIPGAGLPVAMGVRAAAPSSRVFLVSESSALKRHSREFQTAARYGLPVTSFLFQDKPSKPDEEVDFATLARSFGVDAQSVVEPVEEITPEAIEQTFSSKSGTLFDASAS